MIVRVILGALGIVIAVRGGWMLLTNQRFDQLVNAGLWLGGGVVAHDAVLAPVAIVVGWLLIRALPVWARGAATVGAILLGTLTVVAVPMLGAWGRRPDNPSLLPRDYVAGWLVVAGIIVVGSVTAALFARSRQRIPG